MPFPKCNIQFNHNFGTCAREISIEDPETGTLIPKTEDCNKPLPDSENFEIQNQIQAGVTLNEVNTKILNNNDGINMPEFEKAIEEISKTKNSKTKSNNEVTNEDK